MWITLGILKHLGEICHGIRVIFLIWQHVNLCGEYDFSDDVLRKSIEFHLPELKQLQEE